MSRSNCIVILTPTAVYKRFRGEHANSLVRRYLRNQAEASNALAWNGNFVEMEVGPFHTLKGRRLRQLSTEDIEGAWAWVVKLTQQAMDPGYMKRADTLIDFNVLEGFLVDHSGLLARARSQLEMAKLPVGPTHGDLHRKNIVKSDMQFFAIDLDRFKLESCPLFDRLHFKLYEARNNLNKGSERRWANILEDRFEIVEAVAAEAAPARDLQLAYAIQRISFEISTEATFPSKVPDNQKWAALIERFCDLHQASEQTPQ